jgi:conjugal transfer/entry exclusion protein
MPKRLGLSLVLLLGLVATAQAQLPVIDAGNLVQNTTTAIESVLTTIETVLIEANQVLELTPLDEIAVAGGMAEDMQLLGQLVQEAEGLSYDLGALRAQIDALFHLDAAPETTSALQERLGAIRRVRFQCYSYAIRVQTLLRTALRTVEHLQGLLDTLGALIGNMTGNQTIGQFQSVTAKHATNLDVQIAAFHRAQSVDKMEELLTMEALRRINNHVFERAD